MHDQQQSRARQAGFTLIEMLLVTVVLLPILGLVAGISTAVGTSARSIEGAGAAMETVRTTLERIETLVQAASLSTCQVKADASDIAAATAARLLDPSVVVPAPGDWISPPAGATRNNLRFQCANGMLAYNAAPLTAARELGFALALGEIANGIDDNGNGLVDEGNLTIKIGATELVVDRLEVCSFQLNGHLLNVTLQCARQGPNGQVFRARMTQQIYLRNN